MLKVIVCRANHKIDSVCGGSVEERRVCLVGNEKKMKFLEENHQKKIVRWCWKINKYLNSIIIIDIIVIVE